MGTYDWINPMANDLPNLGAGGFYNSRGTWYPAIQKSIRKIYNPSANLRPKKLSRVLLNKLKVKPRKITYTEYLFNCYD